MACGHLLTAQTPHSHAHQRKIVFPDIPGYQTLSCDFHIHTVFSDGSVWPDIRIQEAMKDGLDAIAMTEHLEYQPHKADIPHPDRNRSYHVATESAEGKDLLVINGSEITRNMPPGHSNALFLEDANKLLVEDSLEVFKEAQKQDAFVFWNHPNWTSHYKDGMAKLTDMHLKLIKEGLLHGIEVVNDITYSTEALQIALDHNLTIMGTSDIHGLVDWQYDIPDGGHRPITLVFAKEKTKASIKEALQNRRTIAWFRDYLIGREEFLLPLIRASLLVSSASYKGDTQVLSIKIENNSSVAYTLENLGEFSLHAHTDLIDIPHHATTEILLKTLERRASVELRFKVLNAVTAPKTHPEIRIAVKVGE